ncbi:MAG: SHOCT domain-containing protein [Methanobacteriota archaeon]|nr:MAG: SHOCT domain-containing protein [Euryarchaeota archaeon]
MECEVKKHMMNMGFGIGGFGMGLGLLFWIAVLAALYYALTTGNRSGSAQPTAIDVLKERYARGEIGRDEYQRIRQDL